MQALILKQLAAFGVQQGQSPALQGLHSHLDYAGLLHAIAEVRDWLKVQAPHACVALAMDNCPAWIVLDLALLELQWPHVPIPAFFSPTQKQHALCDAGVEWILTETPEPWLNEVPEAQLRASMLIAGTAVSLLHLPTRRPAPDAVKVTYTSGTTGQPKGVCLDAQSMMQVAHAIVQVVQLTPTDRHCCVLPLATLLENVAGVYATLMAGGCVVVYPTAMVGFSGTQFEIAKLYLALNATAASTAIFIPELLQALVGYVDAGHPALSSLRFLAVGGARVAPVLLNQAHTLGLPAYEGYGLSECASVVTLNAPIANKPGSIGKALPHVQMRVDAHGELWVKGSQMLGYTGNDGRIQRVNLDTEGYLATGDLAYQDADGYWFISGRKKNMFITSFGRNVSPEWVETELNQQAVIMQACLFGEARPDNCAVLVASSDVTDVQLRHAVTLVNQSLPDYAKVARWIRSTQPFTPHNGQLTANGRLKRAAIWQCYQASLEALYKETI